MKDVTKVQYDIQLKSIFCGTKLDKSCRDIIIHVFSCIQNVHLLDVKIYFAANIVEKGGGVCMISMNEYGF